MHPLRLIAKPGNWNLYMARRADSAFRVFQEKVFSRDEYTCQFCGFQANQYQEVVNLDNNYRNNKFSNLVTACCFCAQCFFIESVGVGEYGGGTLVYLPEISQSDVNSFCHVLFCAMTNDTGYKNSAQSIYRSLKFRAQIVEEKFGEGSSNPSAFGQLLIDSDFPEIKEDHPLLSGLRLLPSRAKFKKQIEHWASAALGELSSE
ncbi:MAG: type IVB secretion system protein IcmJDotN [Proteobacteria bacterium]|nr:type IVB secretion system protein IcmJDotN [Pseudomonadota bacterium]